MKDFLDLLVHDYNMPKFLASKIMLIAYIISFLFVIFKCIRLFLNLIRQRYIKKIVDKDLHPYFTSKEIYNYTKLYIPQYFQNITPSEGEEPGRIHAAAAKSKLMKEFLSKGLLTESPIKYFIILSDTGMGKTAFLINLFIRYKRKRSTFARVKYNIELFPLGSTDTLDRIRSIEKKSQTILLLDAFDEDIQAVQNYKIRMIEILENVKEFRKVIFTCRTQFFPTKDEEPTDTDDITFGENIKHKIHKLYLSAFNNMDIFKYLIKKYGLNIIKLHRAYRLVKKSPSLMFRPMLLSYIDDLIKKKLFYNFTYEMYKVLIDTWIDREAAKPAIYSKYGLKRYEDSLMEFSIFLAKNLYTERERRQGYFITVEEIKKLSEQMLIGNLLTLDDKTGRSLLNRNSVGHYKFAHKSILEYFLAIEVFESSEFYSDFDFHGMDATLNFHNEMVANSLSVLQGRFFLSNENKLKVLNTILPKQISKIDKLIIYNSSKQKFERFSSLRHLSKLIFTDHSYKLVYMLYLFICIKKRQDFHRSNQATIRTFNALISEYKSVMNQIEELRPELSYEHIRILVDNCSMDESNKNLFLPLLDSKRENAELSVDEIRDLRQLRNHLKAEVSENVIINDAILDIQRIKKLSIYLKSVEISY